MDQSIPPDNCYVTCLLREKSALLTSAKKIRNVSNICPKRAKYIYCLKSFPKLNT